MSLLDDEIQIAVAIHGNAILAEDDARAALAAAPESSELRSELAAARLAHDDAEGDLASLIRADAEGRPPRPFARRVVH